MYSQIWKPKHDPSAAAEIFNVINANTVLTESETLGTSVAPYLPGGIGGQPSAIANRACYGSRCSFGSDVLN
jgi:hypothetical protein